MVGPIIDSVSSAPAARFWRPIWFDSFRWPETRGFPSVFLKLWEMSGERKKRSYLQTCMRVCAHNQEVLHIFSSRGLARRGHKTNRQSTAEVGSQPTSPQHTREKVKRKNFWCRVRTLANEQSWKRSLAFLGTFLWHGGCSGCWNNNLLSLPNIEKQS